METFESRDDLHCVLRHIQLEIPCTLCSGSYLVSADAVRESQRLLSDCCPGTSIEECAADHYAALLPPDALVHFDQVLEELARGARRRGARAVVLDDPVPPANDASGRVIRDARDLRDSIARWENEGGAVDAPS